MTSRRSVLGLIGAAPVLTTIGTVARQARAAGRSLSGIASEHPAPERAVGPTKRRTERGRWLAKPIRYPQESHPPMRQPTAVRTRWAPSRPAGPRLRLAGLPAILAAATMALAACGGAGSAASTTGSSNYDKALAYAKCMRAHGMPNFPDPDSNGNFDGTTHNGMDGGNGANNSVSAAVKNAAWSSCRSLVPSGGKLGGQQQQSVVKHFLAFAKCMRSHGIPDFPDPGSSNGRIGIQAPRDLHTQSPVYQAAQRACRSKVPRKPKP